MRPAHQHFRLDDRHKLLLLTERSIPRQRVSIDMHTGGSVSRP